MERTIRALNKSKSPGADRIPVEILKDGVHLVSKPLTLIYNTSLEKRIFPQIWKLARVIIYKMGSRTDVSNYRPISVLSAVSSILDKIVRDQVMEYLKVKSPLGGKSRAIKIFSAFTHALQLVDIKSQRKKSRARKLDQVLLFSKSLCSQDGRKWP